MINKRLPILLLLCLFTSMSFAQTSKTGDGDQAGKEKQARHKYGGWYCPDNLNGFPAVDILNWGSVPVVNGRMATKEETQNGTSLIFVDAKKYPATKPLDMKMPKLARFYNESSRKRELVIVIQALNISNDSVVGFRYLNGGNGSARLDEVQFLSESDIRRLPPSRFVTLEVKIDATQAEIWDVLTKLEYYQELQAIFDPEKTVIADWNNSAKVNFKYPNGGTTTSEFGGNVWGNQYIQIDRQLGQAQYVEKFLLLENEATKETGLHIVCGPYGADFEHQKSILNRWSQKVKALSEQK